VKDVALMMVVSRRVILPSQLKAWRDNKVKLDRHGKLSI